MASRETGGGRPVPASMIESGAVYEDRRFDHVSWDGGTLEGVTFRGCTFVRCSLPGTTWGRCRFVDTLFRECDLSLNRVVGSAFVSARYEECKLLGVNWAEADWTGIMLGEPIGFLRCNISHSTLLGLDLRRIVLRDCVARDVDFRDADLRQADLRGSDLAESLFQGADLREADLRGARRYQIDAGKTTITRARFSMPEALSLLTSLDIDLSEDLPA